MFAPKVAKPQTKAATNSTNKLVPQHSVFATRPFGVGTVEQAHFLQRAISNQATLRLLAQRTSKPRGDQLDDAPAQETERMHGRAATPSLSWSFSKIPLLSPDRANRPQTSSPLSTPLPLGVMQRKLVIGEVNDPLEHEADRVADQVMRIPDPELSVIPALPQLSRKCATCEDEAQTLQARWADVSDTAAGEAPDIVHEVLRSSGAPLDRVAQSFMEPRFGHDFSSVRIHADAMAGASARAVNARAYAVGPNVVFGPGAYAPQTEEGRRLLAHELAHVVQQRADPITGTPATSVQTKGSQSLQRQVPTKAYKPTRAEAVPGLGNIRADDIAQSIQNNDFQGAVDSLVGYKYMDYEIDTSLLKDGKITFDPGLTSDDGKTQMASWDYINNKADPAVVKVGPGAFSSVSYLYSVIMHEYQHVLWAQKLSNQQLSHQAQGHGGMDTDEVQAYAWELLNATQTGLDLLPDKVSQVWSSLNDEYWQLDPPAQASSRALVMRALQAAQKFTAGTKQSLDPFKPP